MAEDEKQCSQCGEVKPLDAFAINKQQRDGLHPHCKACKRAKAKAHYAANLEKAKEDQIWRNMKHKYGITRENYAQMLAGQDGACAICGGEQTHAWATRFSVDHDHETGEVRGLLCTNCNTLLGMANDDVDRLMAAAAYLLSFNSVLEKI